MCLLTDSGKSFGEIALISEDSVRNATVIADEETDLLVIHRDLFNRSMKVNHPAPPSFECMSVELVFSLSLRVLMMTDPDHLTLLWVELHLP